MSELSLAIWDKLPPIADIPLEIMNMRMKLRIDTNTWKILLPTQKHVRQIEAKRAMLIMDSIITRVLLVGALPKLMKNLKLYALTMDRETLDLIEELIPVANELEEFKLGKRTSSADSIYRDSMSMQRYSHLKKDIKLRKIIFEVTRKLIRNLMANKAATTAFLRHYIQWDTEPSSEIAEFVKVLVQMRQLLRQALLTTTVDRSRRDNYQYRAERKNVKNDCIIVELTATLDEMTRTHNEFVSKVLKEITFINHQIINLEQNISTETVDTFNKFIEAFHLRRKQFREQMEILTEDNKQANCKLDEIQAKNRAEEHLMMRKKWAVEDEILALQRTNDDKMFDLKTDMDRIEEQLLELKTQDDELLKIYNPIKIEYDAVMEEYRLKAEEEQKEREEKEEMIKSATYIQSMYRGWKSRKAIRKHKRR